MATAKKLKAIPAHIARSQLGELMRRATVDHDQFLIQKAGKPMVVVVGIEDYEDMAEVYAEQTDEKFQETMRESAEEYRLGKYKTLDQILEELEKEES